MSPLVSEHIHGKKRNTNNKGLVGRADPGVIHSQSYKEDQNRKDKISMILYFKYDDFYFSLESFLYLERSLLAVMLPTIPRLS